MLKTVSLSFVVLLLVAGCSTPPKPVPENWQGTNIFQPLPPVVPPPKPPPPPTNPPPKLALTNLIAGTWIPLELWSRVNGLAEPQRISRDLPPAFAVNTHTGVFAFRAASRVAHWDGMELQLGYAPVETNGHFVLHTLDLQKNFSPLLQPGALPPRNHRVIVVDPGHGGINAGAKSVLGNRYEKEFTLDWAKRLAPLLANNGWTVFLTHTNDVDMALSNRVAFAEAHHADFFLSLHFNSAAPDEKQTGLETYCLTPMGMPSNLTRHFEDDAALSFANNSFDTQNLQYAARLHRALLAVNGHKDRGIRRARFMGVLLGQNRPAVLVEGGYLSNPAEAKQIATPAYRQKLAEAIASALQ